MSSPAAYDAIHDRISDNWSATDVSFENDGYELPSDPAPFVYVEIFGDDYFQETTGAPGANMWHEAGMAFLHVMMPIGTGTAAGRAYAKQLMDLFREQPVSTMNFERMSIGAGEPGKDFPNYYALTLSMEWYRRDITEIA